MDKSKAILIYDGDCPFCNQYVRHIRLKESINLELKNARENKKLLESDFLKNINIDEGMVLMLDEKIYTGEECTHILSLMSTRTNLFNKINYAIFKNRKLSMILYPILKTGRNLTLKLIGVDKINNGSGN